MHHDAFGNGDGCAVHEVAVFVGNVITQERLSADGVVTNDDEFTGLGAPLRVSCHGAFKFSGVVHDANSVELAGDFRWWTTFPQTKNFVGVANDVGVRCIFENATFGHDVFRWELEIENAAKECFFLFTFVTQTRCFNPPVLVASFAVF